jgi:hypothetical protein
MSNSGKVWDIREAYKQQRNNSWNQKGDIGIVMGGRTPASTNINSIEKLQLSTSGSAADYGDLTVARSNMSSNAGGNFIRTFAVGGTDPSSSNVIDTVLFSSSGGATNFGDLSAAAYGQAAHSDNTRLVTPQGDGRDNIINYITMNTEGNSADFGDCTNSVIEKGTTGSTTRLITAGGTDSPTSQVNTIQYLTIQSLGNAQDFGDLNFTPRNTAGASNGVRGCFAGGLQFYGAPSPLNSAFNNIDYVTIASTGNATDFGDLTNSVYGATGMSNSASGRGYFAGGSTYPAGVIGSTINTITIATTGNATDFGDLTQAQYLGSGGTNSHGGLEVGAQRPSVTYMPGSGRGLFAGSHDPSASAVIDMISIPTLGNASDFGNLSVARGRAGAGSSLTRLVVGGGETPSATNVIDSTEMQSQGNSADFGNLSVTRNQVGGLSNQTRAVFAGGFVSPTFYDTMDYITIATTGDATDFGNLSAAKGSVGTTSNSTRGLMGGGRSPSQTNVIEYITIGSTGNVTDFGDLTQVMSTNAGASSSTRGLFAGGLNPGDSAGINVTNYVTIASTGNATDFGDLTVARYIVGGGASNNIRAVFAGGKAPGTTNTIDYFTIATTGNAADFGDLNANDAGIAEGQCSDSHGGLQN